MPSQKEILERLQGLGQATISELAGSIALQPSQISKTLSDLKKKGYLINQDGEYQVTERGEEFLSKEPATTDSHSTGEAKFLDAESRFNALLKDYGVSHSERIVDYISALGPTVYQSPAQLLRGLGDQLVAPSKANAIIKHWSSLENLTFPKDTEKVKEPLDPLDEILQTAERLQMCRKVFGGGDSTPEWMTDPLKFIETIKTISGGEKGDEGLKQELSELKAALVGMQNQRTEEQLTSYRQQVDTLTKKIDDLTGHVAELKKPVAGRTEIDLLHEVATEGIDLLKVELPSLRRDVKEFVTGGRLPISKTLEQRGEQKTRLKQALEEDREIEQLGQEIFGTKSRAIEPTRQAPLVYE